MSPKFVCDKKGTPMRNLAIILFITYSFFFNLSAATLNDDFQSGINGWSTSDGTLSIVTQGTSVLDFETNTANNQSTFTKTYSFGLSEANADVNITFDAWATGGWESSGADTDYIHLSINGTEVINSTFSGADGSTSPLSNSYSTSGTADANGDVVLIFTMNVTSTGEHLQLDNILLNTSTVISINAVDDNLTTDSNTLINGNVLTNDTGTGLSIVSTDFSALTGGSVTAFNTTTGAFTYTPNAGFTGTDTFTYVIEDSGSNQDVGTVTIVVTGATDFTCANPKFPFEKTFSTHTHGSIELIGNTILCSDNNDDDVCEDPGGARNNHILMKNIDIDGDSTTFNSSQSKLVLPAGATILYAHLSWQGYLQNGTDANKTRSKTVKFKAPGSASYSTISPSTSDYDFNWVYYSADRWYFQGSANVTDQVQAAGEGWYTIADLFTGDKNFVRSTGDADGKPAGGSFGSWSMTVAFQYDINDTTTKLKNVTIFDGYVGILTGGDETAAENHRVANGCASAGTANTMAIPLDGFLTPKSGAFESAFYLFAGEGDKGATGDYVSLTDKNGTTFFLSNAPDIPNNNPSDDVLNSTITKFGVHANATTLNPFHSTNSNGTDIDTFDTSSILSNYQTTTTVTMNTVGDGYHPGVFAFVTDLFEPNFCFDYAYQQFNRFFTEINTGVPHLKGDVVSGEPIDLRIYLKNQEDSDIAATNLRVSFLDIDATQATYIRNTTRITAAGSINETAIADSSLSVSDTFVRDIPAGDINGLEYFYTYIKLDPSVTSIDMPIKAKIDYNLTIPLGAGTVDIPYSIDTTDRLQLCSDSNFVYQPAYGNFNIAQQNAYSAGKYNIPTQVAQRVDDFLLVSHDAEGNVHDELPVSTTVSVELIDVGGYQDVNVSCNEPSRSISPRIWLTFESNTSQLVIDETTIQNAIDEGRISDRIGFNPNPPIQTAKEFFKEARESAAFRVSYNLADGNGSLIKLVDVFNGAGNFVGYNLLNFTELIAVNDGKCLVDVDGNLANEDTIPQFCNNAGVGVGAAMTEAELAVCMECVYGYRVQYDCSRDNFAIRPEAFNVKVYDNNESNSNTFPTNAVPNNGAMAAGYKYRYDINATSHASNAAVSGYTKSYLAPNTDNNITYYWRPNGRVVSGCNDRNNSNPPFYIVDGSIENNQSKIVNVGRYELEMRDKAWTKVDQAPLHHISDPAHFYLDDCTYNQNYVPNNAAVLTSATVGCDISSSHTNSDIGMTYRDTNVTVHPYAFDVTGIQFEKGYIDSPVVLSPVNPFVYQNSIENNTDDMNMSVRFTGPLTAVGKDNTALNNFVDNCYAEPLNLDVNTSDLPSAPLYSYRLRVKDTNTSVVLLDNIRGNSAGATNIVGLVTLPTAGFTQENNGTSNIELNLNFARTVNNPFNPIELYYRDMNASCLVPSDCDSRTELMNSVLPIGSVNSDLNVTHLYGREHVPRHRSSNPTITVPISYEFYCDSDVTSLPVPCQIANHNIVSPNRLLSQDDIRWYVQVGHNPTVDGNTSFTQTRGGAHDALFNDMNITNTQAAYTYDETRGYPFKATIEVTTQDWLIYNRYDGGPTVNNGGNVVNSFELEFFSTGQWGGQDNTGGVNTNTLPSADTNRRIQW